MHIYILGPKLLQWIFFQILQLSITKWCAQTFPPIFGLFAIFDRHFSEFVATSSDGNENHVLDLDLDNSRQEPEAITATSGCALRKSGEPTLEGRSD